MSKFSEHLDQSIINSGMTESQLAKLSGFTRSYIALMKSGRRVPPDRIKMGKLIEALNLSPHEHDEIWSEYMRARLGEDTYKIDNSIVEFIQSFNQISTLNIKSYFNHEIPEISTITNRMDLEYFLKVVCENESKKADGFLHMMIQNDTSGLTNFIYGMLDNNSHLKVEHILCMDSVKDSSSGQIIYNIELLKNLMPLALSDYSKNYEVFYYYGSIVEHSGMTSLMPFVIITSGYVVLVSEETDAAIVLNCKEICMMYETRFQRQKQKCKPLFSRLNDYEDLSDSYAQAHFTGDKMYFFSDQPCFGIFDIAALARKYYCLEDKRVLKTLEELNKRNYIFCEKHNFSMTAYCTESGIRRFMDTGRVDEIAKELYRPIEPKDRIDMLTMLVDSIKNKKYTLNLIDEKKFDYPRMLFLSGSSIFNVRIQILSERANVRFMLNEASLSKAVYDFCARFGESSYALNREKSRAILEKLLEEYTEKFFKMS